MKIIRQGTPPEDILFTDECRHCHTVFEYQRKEAQFYADQRDGDYLAIDCPICGKSSTRNV